MQISSRLHAFLSCNTERVNHKIDDLLPAEKTYPHSIHRLMRYSVFAGGKRLRPALIRAAYEACDGMPDSEAVTTAGAAIEMLHTFSLIHDDLPCMDDDNYRRGKPTAHKAFGEALAVLGGDALCIYAFECLAALDTCALVSEVASALGTSGMIGGQVADIEAEGRTPDAAMVDYIHQNKTAALIRTCVRVGGMLAGAQRQRLDALTAYGNKIGLAFQVVDDILDEEQSTDTLGKDAGSDKIRGKATYPALYSMPECKKRAHRLIEQACTDITVFEDNAEMLVEIARYIETRLS
jgi:geranylgeranyl diphosphate synthase type II